MPHVSEIALFTEDVDAMVEFYSRLPGMRTEYRGNDIAILMLGETKVLIHFRYKNEVGQPPNEDHTAIGVTELDAKCAELVGLGLQLLIEPRAYDWGRSAYLRDPDGRLIELTESKST